MRVSELEAQASALAVVNDRLTRSRDALVDDAFTAEDLLCAAAERMRRSRGSRSVPTAAAAGTDGSGGDFPAPADIDDLPPRSLFPDPRGAGDLAGSAEFAVGRLSGGSGGGRGRGAARGRHWSLSPSPRLSASVPEWHGSGSSIGGGAENTGVFNWITTTYDARARGGGSPPSSASIKPFSSLCIPPHLISRAEGRRR